MYKLNSGRKNNNDGEDLTPKKWKLPLFSQSTESGFSGIRGRRGRWGTNPEQRNQQMKRRLSSRFVRTSIEGMQMDQRCHLEDIIAAQKADLDTLLTEIDKLQASNDMNSDNRRTERSRGRTRYS